jgi:hypothetical protein
VLQLEHAREQTASVLLHAREQDVVGERLQHRRDFLGPRRLARIHDPEAEEARNEFETKLRVLDHEIFDRGADAVLLAPLFEREGHRRNVAEAAGYEVRSAEADAACVRIGVARALGDPLRGVIHVAPRAGPTYVVFEDEERTPTLVLMGEDRLELLPNGVVIVIAVDDVGVDLAERVDRLEARLLEEGKVRRAFVLLVERDRHGLRRGIDADQLSPRATCVVAKRLREFAVLGADLGDGPSARKLQAAHDDLSEVRQRVGNDGLGHGRCRSPRASDPWSRSKAHASIAIR